MAILITDDSEDYRSERFGGLEQEPPPKKVRPLVGNVIAWGLSSVLGALGGSQATTYAMGEQIARMQRALDLMAEQTLSLSNRVSAMTEVDRVSEVQRSICLGDVAALKREMERVGSRQEEMYRRMERVERRVFRE